MFLIQCNLRLTLWCCSKDPKAKVIYIRLVIMRISDGKPWGNTYLWFCNHVTTKVCFSTCLPLIAARKFTLINRLLNHVRKILINEITPSHTCCDCNSSKVLETTLSLSFREDLINFFLSIDLLWLLTLNDRLELHLRYVRIIFSFDWEYVFIWLVIFIYKTFHQTFLLHFNLDILY